MKELLKKLVKTELNKKLLAVGAALILLIIIVPVARIMMYCVPWYDDFGYGWITKAYWELNHSFLEALQGVFLHIKLMWFDWQGTYTSAFFMSLMPAVWGTDKYVYGLWICLALLIIGIFCLVKELLWDVVKCRDRWSIFVVQCLSTGLIILLMRSAIEGLFWYNSAMHYTTMHGLAMLYIAGLIKLVYAPGKLQTGWLVAGSVVGALLLGGTNNITALQTGLVILSILGFGLIFKKKRVLWLLPATGAYVIALSLNMGAPGNAKRMVYYVDMMISPIEAILRSFQCTFTYFWDFTGWMTLVFVIALIPVLWMIVSKTDFRFPLPGLVLLWSYCLYATGFTPTLYVTGEMLIGRATNMVKVTFQILLLINICYFLGWLCRYLREKKDKTHVAKHYWSFYLLVGLMMIVVFAAEPNKGGKFSSYCAYYFVHTGEAYNYYQEYLDRVEICESDEKDVVVRPFVFKPWLLCLGDLSEDPKYEPNYFMALFYGKDSIVCKPAEETQE